MTQFGTAGATTCRSFFWGKYSAAAGGRARALLHTWMGACLALRLAGQGVQHIHLHHGYFSSWVAMVAARLLHIGFSMTLHGSDLLVNRAYTDVKLGEEPQQNGCQG